MAARTRVLAALLIVIVSAAAAALVKHQADEVASSLVMVLGVTVAGALCGLTGGLLAAAVSFFIYNFYLADPILTFSLQSQRDIAPFVAFTLCALVAGLLAGKLKDAAGAAARSNAQLVTLLRFSESLHTAVELKDILRQVETAASDAGWNMRVIQRELGRTSSISWRPASAQWHGIAEQAFENPDQVIRDGSLVGFSTGITDGAGTALVVDGEERGPLEEAFLRSIANLVDLAVERAALSRRIMEGVATARTEKLKSALLSSVSHDFRTPLTTIKASASSLGHYKDRLDRDTQAKLLQSIVDECERLNRYTANLLEMSRLEGGQPLTGLQAISVSDMLRNAINRVPNAGGRRTVLFSSDQEIAVLADPALFELALSNVLENAVRYSDEGTTVAISAERAGHECEIVVSDEGYGIPRDDLGKVFERFYRVPRGEQVARGSGLGLAIAKGFVDALNGRITAESPGRRGCGTSIVIRLPVAEPCQP